MKVEGILTNKGKKTLYISDAFDSYYNYPENGRVTTGRMTKSLYVGEVDISGIKVGSEIDIYYGEPVTTKTGTYAPIKKIEIIKE